MMISQTEWLDTATYHSVLYLIFVAVFFGYDQFMSYDGVLPPKSVLTILIDKIWNPHTQYKTLSYCPQDCSLCSDTKNFSVMDVYA